MIHDSNVLKMRTYINKDIINTVPDRKFFEEFQEKRVTDAMREDIHKKTKFTWTDDDDLISKVLLGEVVVMHVDEYEKLLKTLKTYKEINERRGRHI
ncbi:hypothetical protein CKQ70_30665 [Bacillus toyonensis]|nr:hypothetical protein CKQ70_30665 [Bacillus toyonensis]PAW43690.1 hypothetical protein CKQ69_30785 [Bacillus toyonensis]